VCGGCHPTRTHKQQNNPLTEDGHGLKHHVPGALEAFLAAKAFKPMVAKAGPCYGMPSTVATHTQMVWKTGLLNPDDATEDDDKDIKECFGKMG